MKRLILDRNRLISEHIPHLQVCDINLLHTDKHVVHTDSSLLYFSVDADKPQSSHATVESSASLRSTDAADKFANIVKEATRAELDLRQQRVAGSSSRPSTDRSPKLDGGSNGLPYAASSQHEHVRPLLSLLEKEPPSRHFSGQFDVRQLAGIEKHESIVPLLHASNEKKANGELDFLMAEFAGILFIFPCRTSTSLHHYLIVCVPSGKMFLSFEVVKKLV